MYCALACSSALAEPSKEELQVARTLFGQALAEEKLEHWDAALAKLESVQAIKASPSVRYHIALCEEKLGRLAAALSDYEAARVAARNEGNKEVLAIVDEPIARLTAEVPHVTLSLASPPRDAKIDIDGRNLSAIGFNVAIPLDPGPHVIRVSAPEHATFQHSLTLQPKGDVAITVSLPAAAAAPVTQSPPREPHVTYPARPYAIATTAGAVVLAGAGLGLFLGAGAARSGHLEPNQGCRAESRADACDGVTTRVNVLDWSAGAAWLAAAGLAATSVVLWTRPGKTETASTGSRTRLSFGPGRVALEGTFE